MEKEKGLATTKSQDIIQQENAAESLLALAIKQGTPLETIEKFMDLRDREEKRVAKIAFDDAMAKLQGQCPVIAKKKQGNNYKYAPLDDIVSQVRSLLQECGFSYRIEATMDVDMVIATCVAVHKNGHSEKSSFTAKIEKVVSKTGSSVRTAMQDSAASLTFAKRYAFCNAFGIMTGDEDTDARRNSIEPKQRNLINDLTLAMKRNGAKDHAHAIEIFNKLTGSNATKYPENNADAQAWLDLLTSSPQYVS